MRSPQGRWSASRRAGRSPRPRCPTRQLTDVHRAASSDALFQDLGDLLDREPLVVGVRGVVEAVGHRLAVGRRLVTPGREVRLQDVPVAQAQGTAVSYTHLRAHETVL